MHFFLGLQEEDAFIVSSIRHITFPGLLLAQGHRFGGLQHTADFGALSSGAYDHNNFQTQNRVIEMGSSQHGYGYGLLLL